MRRGRRSPIGLVLAMERAIFAHKEPPVTAPRDKAFPVSWDQFHRDARALAWRLASAGPFNAIVAITRGGLVPAAIVARELEVRVIETVSIASYHDYKTKAASRSSRRSLPMSPVSTTGRRS